MYIKKRINTLLLLLCIILFLSCSQAPLSVQTEYFRPKDLASSVIGTPDPDKEADIFGQRIRICWSLSKEDFSKGAVELVIAVRLKNSDEQTRTYPITTRSGELTYPVVGPDFFEKGGVLSYSIQLQAGTEILAESKHRFWVDKVVV